MLIYFHLNVQYYQNVIQDNCLRFLSDHATISLVYTNNNVNVNQIFKTNTCDVYLCYYS